MTAVGGEEGDSLITKETGARGEVHDGPEIDSLWGERCWGERGESSMGGEEDRRIGCEVGVLNLKEDEARSPPCWGDWNELNMEAMLSAQGNFFWN